MKDPRYVRIWIPLDDAKKLFREGKIRFEDEADRDTFMETYRIDG